MLLKKWNIFLILIILLASFLRFYNLPYFLHFETDQADESFTIKNMLTKSEIPLKGVRCGSCATEIYTFGPVYFYLLSISYIVFNFHPFSGALLTALLGIFSVYLCYKLGTTFFNRNVGLVSAFLFSFTPFIVAQSRYQAMMNLIPFFVLLCLYSLLKIKQNKQNYWYLFSFSLGILLQLHLTNLFFIPAIILFFLFFKPKIKVSKVIKSFLIIVILFVPYLIHEFPSNFSNTSTFMMYFLKGSGNLGLNSEMLYSFLVSQSFWGRSIVIAPILFISSLTYSFYIIKKRDKKHKEIAFLILWVLLILCIQITSGFLHPAPGNFLVIIPATVITYGFFIFSIFKTRNKFLISYIIILLIFMLIFFTIGLYYELTTGVLLGDKMKAVSFIIQNSTEDVAKMKFERKNWDELPYLYIFDYYWEKINVTNEPDYIIIDPVMETSLFEPYVGKIEFRKDFGTVSVIRITN